VDKRRPAPRVHIENVSADHKNYQPTAGLDLPAQTHDVRIDYTALSFIAPQKVKFRHRLDGYDDAWQDETTRRQATYTNLRPGDYSFRVAASNSDGVWHESGATLSFAIPPLFYQTNWFLVLCVAAMVGLGCIAYLTRMRQVAARIEDRLAARASERERIARDMHDTLLQTIQGGKLVADAALDTPDDAVLRKELQRISGWLGHAVTEARASLTQLRGLESIDEDLDSALRHIAEECTRVRALRLQFASRGEPRRMQPIVREEIYQIAREAIRNAVEHSGGSQLFVEIAYLNYFTVAVRDDGRGIDSVVAAHGKEGHFGIRGMRERASRIGAQLSLVAHSTGTEVRLTVPHSILMWSQPESRFLFRLRSFLRRRSKA